MGIAVTKVSTIDYFIGGSSSGGMRINTTNDTAHLIPTTSLPSFDFRTPRVINLGSANTIITWQNMFAVAKKTENSDDFDYIDIQYLGRNLPSGQGAGVDVKPHISYDLWKIEVT